MPEDSNSLIAFFNSRSELAGKNSVSDISRAIESFRHNSPAIPVERLYSAYRSLKEMIDSMGPDFASQSVHFNDIFLRILEERGESGSGIYRSVLRDSSEFRFLSGIFIKDDMPAPDGRPEPVEEDATAEPPVILTLKSILADKKVPLTYYSEDDWDKLVDEHFRDFADQTELVKISGAVLNRIIKRGDCLDYHIVCIVQYIFSRLNKYKKTDISSKEYAMKLMNMVSDKSDTWNRLHREYLEIIKK